MIEYENLAKLNAPFQSEFKACFENFVDSGWYILGEQVKAFEAEFANFCGAKYAIGVASGLDALQISLRALELPPGSEVLTPANSYIATVLAIIHAGLTPVLVEPKQADSNMDPAAILQAITSRTRAILPIHLYGASCDMSAIMAIAQDHDLHVIEDCAQAHDARYNNQHVGTFGTFGAFSFYPTKNLGALGDAGAIITNDTSHYERCLQLRNYGEKSKYVNEIIGLNSRLDELQAAMLRVKLKKLPVLTAHKQSLAKLYCEHLNDNVKVPQYEDNISPVFHIFAVRSKKRDQLRAYLQSHQIQTQNHYPTPPYRQKALQGRFVHEYPVSDEWHNEQISLPISGIHTHDDIYRVIETINSWRAK